MVGKSRDLPCLCYFRAQPHQHLHPIGMDAEEMDRDDRLNLLHTARGPERKQQLGSAAPSLSQAD